MDFSGWERPVNVIQSQMRMDIEGQIMRAVQNVGVIVDKEELIKALRYDRGQYDKGFANGYNKAIDDFVEKIQWEYLNGCGIKQREIEFLVVVSNQVAEQLKAGGVDARNI